MRTHVVVFSLEVSFCLKSKSGSIILQSRGDHGVKPMAYGPILKERMQTMGDEITSGYGFDNIYDMDMLRQYLWLNGNYIVKKVL